MQRGPIGKAALMYVATAGLGNLAGGLGGASKWGNMFGKAGWMRPSSMAANWLGTAGTVSAWLPAAKYASRNYKAATSGILGKGWTYG